MKLLKNKTGAMDDNRGEGVRRRERDERREDYRGEREDHRGERDVRRERDDGKERGNVFDRLDMGRSWNRAEERMERQRSARHKTESPRKKRSNHDDLRSKLKKSLKSQTSEEMSENVTFTKPTAIKLDELETDELVLNRREKQLEYGKNTIDYDTYCRIIPKDDRKDTMPRTPVKNKKYSRRQWDGMVKNWKQMIHTLVARYNENDNDDMEESSEEGTGVSNWAEEVEEEEESQDKRRRRTEDEEDL